MKKLPEEIITKIKQENNDATKDEPIAQLKDGQFVIGTYIDTDNHSHFIVRDNNDDIIIIDAENAPLVQMFIDRSRSTFTVKVKKV